MTIPTPPNAAESNAHRNLPHPVLALSDWDLLESLVNERPLVGARESDAQKRSRIEALAAEARAGLSADSALDPACVARVESLVLAADAGDLDAVRMHLAEDPELARVSLPGSATALIYAACHGHLACLLELLPHSDTRAVAECGSGSANALMCAAAYGHLDCLLALLPHSEALAVTDRGLTALMCAARHGRLDCLNALLPFGGARLMDNRGRTAMQVACKFGHAECADALALSSSAVDTNAAFSRFGRDGMPCWASQIEPLFDAVELDMPEALRDLLRAPGGRQRAQARNGAGLTPLLAAIRTRRLECIDVLAPFSDCEDPRGAEGRNALMDAAGAGDVECAQLLLPHVDPSARDHKGRTALMLAVLSGLYQCGVAGSVECAALLCSPEACREVDKEGRTALMMAAETKQKRARAMVDLLIPHSDVDWDASGQRGHCGKTALMCALEARNGEAVEALAPVSNLSISDHSGDQAIVYAIRAGDARAVALIAERADWRAREGVAAAPRPLMMATCAGRVDMVDLLLPRCDANASAYAGRGAGGLYLLANYYAAPGETALMIAARHGDSACAKSLLRESDACARDLEGFCAIDRALDNGHAAIADLLAPFSPPEAAARAFEVFDREGMPAWAARLEADELAVSLGLVREPRGGSPATGEARAKAARL